MRAEGRRLGAWFGAGLAVTLLFCVWIRSHTFAPTLAKRLGFGPWPVVRGEAEPLDCDEAAYAYMGRRMGRGDVLYRDLTENKPPLGYWLYALAVAIGGAEELTIRVMPIPYVLATIVLLGRLGLRLGGPAAGVGAGFLYAVASTDPYLYGNGANLEHFINLFSVASLAALIAAWPRTGRGLVVAAGAFVGVACLVKQVAFVHGLVYAAALLFRAGSWRRKALNLLALAGGFALAWGPAIGVLIARGAGAAAFDDIVRYGGALAADTPADPHAPSPLVRWLTGNADPRGALPWPFGRTKYLVWWGAGTWPLWLAGAAAVAWLMRDGRMAEGRGQDRERAADAPAAGERDRPAALVRPAPRRLVAAWTISACVQVILPGLYWQHYYLLPVPGICLAVALLLVEGVRRIRSSWRAGRVAAGMGWAAVAAGMLAAIGATGVIQVRDYLLVPAEELTVRHKGGGQWVELRRLGRDLARRVAGWPDASLYNWGWQSPLYIYAGLDGVTPHFFVDPLLRAFADGDHPLIRPRLERIMADLRARKPPLILCGYPPFPALRAFLAEHYERSALGGLGPNGEGLWVARGRLVEFERRRDRRRGRRGLNGRGPRPGRRRSRPRRRGGGSGRGGRP